MMYISAPLVSVLHHFYTKTVKAPRDKYNLLKPSTYYNFSPGISIEGLGQEWQKWTHEYKELPYNFVGKGKWQLRHHSQKYISSVRRYEMT